MAALRFAACCSNSTLVATVGASGGGVLGMLESPGRILATTRTPAVAAAATAVSPPAQYSRFRGAFEAAFCAEISCASRVRAKWFASSEGCSVGEFSRKVSITSFAIVLYSLVSCFDIALAYQ